MTTTANKTEIENPFDLLRALRDEIRIRIHLAGMEAKEQWEKLDRDAEKLTQKAERASGKALDELIGKLKQLRKAVPSR